MTTLFRGGEDIDFVVIGGAYGTTNAAGIWINSTAGSFPAYRTEYARCGLSPRGHQSGFSVLNNVWIRTRAFSSSNFWMTARMAFQGGNNTSTSFHVLQDGLIRWRDAGLVTQLRLMPIGAAPPTFQGGHSDMTQPFELQLPDGTVLATSTSGFSVDPSSPDKLDMHISGSGCQMYINGTLVLTYTGGSIPVPLAYVEYGSIAPVQNSLANTNWSEVIVSTLDTRNQSLVIRRPVADGATTDWSGAVTDVNGLQANDASPNLSTLADEIQEYTLTPMPSGDFAILDVTQTARTTVGITGPQHLQLGNRIVATEYFSTDIAPAIAWDTVSYSTSTNPATAVAYTKADLDAASYNIAMKSTA